MDEGRRPRNGTLPSFLTPSPSRGLLAAALAWLAGTVLLHQMPRLPGLGGYVALALVALLGSQCRSARWLVWLAAGFAWAAWCAEARLADRLPGEQVGADHAVIGWVDGFPSRAPDRVRFSLRVSEAEEDWMPRRLRLTWYYPPDEIAAGDELSLVVRLRRPRGNVNPGGFDFERWLFLEGYGATGYVRSGAAASGEAATLAQWWFTQRARLAERIDAASPSAEASALVTALTLGERSGFDDRHWESLRRTGTSHLVAISGMHVGLVAALMFVLVRRVWLRLPGAAALYDLEAAAICAASAAAVYAALAGFAVPTQRALVMVVTALVVVVSRRTVGPFNGLAAALLLVLIWDPLAPLGASFWMSFVAVALLLLMAEPRPVNVPRAEGALRARQWVVVLARFQWSITLGLVPLVSLYFGELSLVSPVVNMLAIPWFSFVLVPLALLAALGVTISAVAGGLLVQASGRLAEATWAALHVVAAWPWSAAELAPPTPWLLVLAFAGVLAAVPRHALPGRRLAWLVLLPLAASSQPPRPAPGTLRATMLDVGHGLAVLVDTHERRLLYDAGPSYASGFDSGSDIVLPAMAALGGRPLDLVVVSHDHNDHTGGVAAVLAAHPAAAVLKGPDVERYGGRSCVAGQSWTWDDVDFLVLHPAGDFSARGNESSCVLKAATPFGALLLTGDIEAHAERSLREESRLRAEVVVVPHHGSRTSSSAAFVEATAAELALVSTDYYSRWDFPRPEIRRRWEAAGARMVVTGERGAVSVEIGPAGIQATAARDRRLRYWAAETTSRLPD